MPYISDRLYSGSAFVGTRRASVHSQCASAETPCENVEYKQEKPCFPAGTGIKSGVPDIPKEVRHTAYTVKATATGCGRISP